MRRTAVVLILAVVGLLGSGIAAAHNAGRVELLVTNLAFHRTADGLAVGADDAYATPL